MNVFLYVILIIIFILISLLLKNRSVVMTILCSLLIVVIIFNPKVCISAAISGAALFFYKVFPSIFPFVVLSQLILAYDGIDIYSRLLGPLLCKPMRLPKSCSFVLIISALCGYPLGAKYACNLYEEKNIDRNTCERLINIASNPSPLFIIGAVGTSMLGSRVLGYILLSSCYLSCFVMGILIPAKYNNTINIVRSETSVNNYNFGNALKGSIDSAIKTSLTICGFVTIFSVINSILKSSIIINTAIVKFSNIFGIPLDLLQGTFLGLIEMTNGCNEISAAAINLKLKIVIISFLLTFSGVSVIFQVYSFTYKHNYSLKKYVLLKLLQGLVSACISIILVNIINIRQCLPSSNISIYSSSHISTNIVFVVLLLMLLPFGAGKFLKRLFHTL